MPGFANTFRTKDGGTFDIGDEDQQAFLSDFPDAKRMYTFRTDDGGTFDIGEEDASAFMQDFPTAKQVVPYKFKDGGSAFVPIWSMDEIQDDPDEKTMSGFGYSGKTGGDTREFAKAVNGVVRDRKYNALTKKVTSEMMGRERKDLGGGRFEELPVLKGDAAYDENAFKAGFFNNAFDEIYRSVNGKRPLLTVTGQEAKHMIQAAGQMNDAEVGAFNFLAKTEGEDAARAYMRHILPELNRRHSKIFEENVSDFAKKHPVAASALSVAGNIGRVVEIPTMLADKAAGLEVDPNSPSYNIGRGSDIARGTVSSNIDSSVGRFVYDATMSVLDNAANIAISGGAGGVVKAAASGGAKAAVASAAKAAVQKRVLSMMGTEAAMKTVLDAKQKGYNDVQAIGEGALFGAIEVLTEKIPLGNLFEPKLFRDSLKKVLVKQIGEEFAEEAMAEVLDKVTDAFVGRGKSDAARAVEEYKSNGASDSQAVFSVIRDTLGEAGMAGLAGAFSGAIMGGANVAARAPGIAHISNRMDSHYAAIPNLDQSLREGVTPLMQEKILNVASAMHASSAANLTAEQGAEIAAKTREDILKEGGEKAAKLYDAVNEQMGEAKYADSDELKNLHATFHFDEQGPTDLDRGKKNENVYVSDEGVVLSAITNPDGTMSAYVRGRYGRGTSITMDAVRDSVAFQGMTQEEVGKLSEEQKAEKRKAFDSLSAYDKTMLLQQMALDVADRQVRLDAAHEANVQGKENYFNGVWQSMAGGTHWLPAYHTQQDFVAANEGNMELIESIRKQLSSASGDDVSGADNWSDRKVLEWAAKNTEGAHYNTVVDGEVVPMNYIILENCHTPQDVMRVVMHETGIHEALEGMLGDTANNPEAKEFFDLVAPDGIEDAKAALEAMGYKPGENITTEEALALLRSLETGAPTRYERGVHEFKNVLRRAASKIGLNVNSLFRITDSDLQVMFDLMRNESIRGEGGSVSAMPEGVRESSSGIAAEETGAVHAKLNDAGMMGGTPRAEGEVAGKSLFERERQKTQQEARDEARQKHIDTIKELGARLADPSVSPQKRASLATRMAAESSAVEALDNEELNELNDAMSAEANGEDETNGEADPSIEEERAREAEAYRKASDEFSADMAAARNQPERDEAKRKYDDAVAGIRNYKEPSVTKRPMLAEQREMTADELSETDTASLEQAQADREQRKAEADAFIERARATETEREEAVVRQRESEERGANVTETEELPLTESEENEAVEAAGSEYRAEAEAAAEEERQRIADEEARRKAEAEAAAIEEQKRRRAENDKRHADSVKCVDMVNDFGDDIDKHFPGVSSSEEFNSRNAEQIDAVNEALRRNNPQMLEEALGRLRKRMRNYYKANRGKIARAEADAQRLTDAFRADAQESLSALEAEPTEAEETAASREAGNELRVERGAKNDLRSATEDAEARRARLAEEEEDGVTRDEATGESDEAESGMERPLQAEGLSSSSSELKPSDMSSSFARRVPASRQSASEGTVIDVSGGAKFSRVTPEEDAAYMDAAKRGDMETAQRMVREAAKVEDIANAETGRPITLEGYHATPEEFNVFDKDKIGSVNSAMFLDAFYVSDTRPRSTKWNVKHLYVSFMNPLVLDIDKATFDTIGAQEIADSVKRGMFHPALDEYLIANGIVEADENGDYGESLREWYSTLGDIDGLIVKNTQYDSHKNEYAAFEPNQLKSADPVTRDDAGNVIPLSKRFDQKNNDIRFSLATPFDYDVYSALPAASNEAAERASRDIRARISRSPVTSDGMREFLDSREKAMDRIRRKIQDMNLPIKRLEEHCKTKDGKPITEKESVYYAEDRRFGIDTFRTDQFMDNTVGPILDRMNKLGVSQEELDTFLKANYAEERNKMIAERSDGENMSGSGMTNERANELLDGFRSSGKFDALSEVAEMVYAMNRQVLENRVAAGLMSRAQADAFLEGSPHYVPLRHVEEGEIDDPIHGQTTINKGEFKHAVGRATEADSPLNFSIQQAFGSILREDKNAVRQKLLELVRANPEIGTFRRDQPSKTVYDPKTGKNKLQVDQSYNEDQNDSVVHVKEGGELYYIELNGQQGKLVKRAITQRGLVRPPEMITNVTSFMARMRTSWVPTFLVRNLVADNTQVLRNLASDGYAMNIGEFERNIPFAVKSMWRYSHGTGVFAADAAPMDSGAEVDAKRSRRMDKLAKEYVENGGLIGGASQMAFSDVDAELKKKLNKALKSRTRFEAIKNGAGYVLDQIEKATSPTENGTRLAVYAMLREQGVSVEKAISYSRDVTVNFNRKGEWTPVVNSLYMFSNASIQDIERTIRSMSGREALRMGKNGHGASVITACFALSLIASALSWAAAGLRGKGRDDEYAQAEGSHKNLQEYVKSGNITMEIPGLRYFTKIPVRGLAVIPHYLGQKTGDVLFGGEDPAKAAMEVASVIGEVSVDPLPSSATMLQSVSPNVLQPFVQAGEKKTWTGDDLERRQFDDNMPKAYNGKNSTPNGYKATAKFFNSATGGNEFKKGWGDVSPEMLQLITQSIGGGVWSDTSRFEDVVESAVKGEWSVDKTPFLRDFLRESPDNTSRFYSAMDAQSAIETEYNGFQKAKDFAKAKEVAAKNPSALPGRQKALKNIADKVKDLRESERTAKTKQAREQFEKSRLRLQARYLELMVQYNESK